MDDWGFWAQQLRALSGECVCGADIGGHLEKQQLNRHVDACALLQRKILDQLHTIGATQAIQDLPRSKYQDIITYR